MLKKERVYFSIVDGIIAGESQEPFCPHSKRANVLIAGNDLLAVDIASVQLMGLAPRKIRYLNYSINGNQINLDDIAIASQTLDATTFFTNESPYLDFSVPEQWRGLRH